MIKVVHNYKKKSENRHQPNEFSSCNTQHILKFHQSFPSYAPTPLVKLDQLACYLGIKQLYVKDEHPRFDLNAFKVLGGSYCVATILAEKLDLDITSMTYTQLHDYQKRLGNEPITFVTATDGNHGRGIAWTAQQLGQKSVVYLPKGSAEERLENIRKMGADAEIVEYNYDDTVRLAREKSRENGWILVQDTAWQGYELIPKRIMQGYITMAHEIVHQLENQSITHLFLQAGVGSMAAAMTAFFVNYYSENPPQIIIVEPDKADCIFKTASASDGKLHYVTQEMDTIMAGLACGEPSYIAWDILSSYADYFVSISDEIAAKGMRILGNPLEGDAAIISGESGAATAGLVVELLTNAQYDSIKHKFGLDETSCVLCLSTEGDTDQQNYREIVWEGKYPTFKI